MSVKLEKLFLMNVSLYLETRFDVFNFIQINKKCHESICMLKINPSSIDDYSKEWFSKHFSPDTVDKRCSVTFITDIDKKATFIRKPFYIFEEEEDRSLLIELIPKITHLSFRNYYDTKEEEYFHTVIENAEN